MVKAKKKLMCRIFKVWRPTKVSALLASILCNWVKLWRLKEDWWFKKVDKQVTAIVRNSERSIYLRQQPKLRHFTSFLKILQIDKKYFNWRLKIEFIHLLKKITDNRTWPSFGENDCCIKVKPCRLPSENNLSKKPQFDVETYVTVI